MDYIVFIQRTYKDRVTLSNIEVFDGSNVIYRCKGLELPWVNNERRISCVPEGLYTTVARKSARYDEHFHLLDVPARDLILIHHGNFVTRDTLGCIIVGRTISDIDGDGICDVTSSKATMDELKNVLPDEFITVIYKEGDDPYKHIF